MNNIKYLKHFMVYKPVKTQCPKAATMQKNCCFMKLTLITHYHCDQTGLMHADKKDGNR
jgi:hypothetical protein